MSWPTAVWNIDSFLFYNDLTSTSYARSLPFCCLSNGALIFLAWQRNSKFSNIHVYTPYPRFCWKFFNFSILWLFRWPKLGNNKQFLRYFWWLFSNVFPLELYYGVFVNFCDLFFSILRCSFAILFEMMPTPYPRKCIA